MNLYENVKFMGRFEFRDSQIRVEFFSRSSCKQ